MRRFNRSIGPSTGLSFLAFTLLLAGCAKTGGDSIEGVSAGMLDSTITDSPVDLIVHGMSCPLCANNVDKQLLSIPGVEAVEVNLNDGLVRVNVSESSPPTYRALADAVERSGFTLKSIR